MESICVFIAIIGIVIIIALFNKLKVKNANHLYNVKALQDNISQLNNELKSKTDIYYSKLNEYKQRITDINIKNHEQTNILLSEKNRLIEENKLYLNKTAKDNERIIFLNNKINSIRIEKNNIEINGNELVNKIKNEAKLKNEALILEHKNLYEKIKDENKINIDKIEKTYKIDIGNIEQNYKKEIFILEHHLKHYKKELEKEESIIYKLKKQNIFLEKEIDKLKSGIKLKDELFISLKKKSNESVSKITSLYSDFLFVQFDISSKYLEIKKHPAKKEALKIRELKAKYKYHFENYKKMLYKYEYLLQLFPELSDYVDDFESIQKMNDIESLDKLKDDFDRVKEYISKDEYNRLDTDSRNQLALDNYIKSRKKSNWQIGRDYELMCGIEYQKDNWDVEFIGMEKKFQDMGRDLIAKKGNETLIIQCKLWKKNKIIHENHLAQLYGTTKAYGYNELALWKVKPVFITNIELSDTAKLFAEILDIKVIKKNLSEFPRIKCNITKDKEGKLIKIYHLPFDQQYDRTQIKHKGEFYAYTVKEAVEKGFRRAFRYNIKSNS